MDAAVGRGREGFRRTQLKSVVLAAVLAALLLLPATSSAAPLGRVVALGDSLASGQWLGPQVAGSITDCGRSTGGYPELAMARVAHGAWVNATCNGTTADNFENGWTAPSGTAIPPQYNSLNGNEDLIIVGSGSNEAFFGRIAYDCTGYQPAVDAFFHNRDSPQQPPWPIPNHCSDTYLVGGVNQIPNYVAVSKSKMAAALTRIHQLSPQAKILLMGTPRIAKPSGSQCFSSEFWLTATDAPLYATWEDGVRQAMIANVSAFNAAAGGNYAHFVDMQAISGSSHTACEPTWGARWMNPHTYQQGPQYPGIALHNTPLGASVTANAIVDAIHAKGFDTGTTPADPVVSITSPVSGIVTTNAVIPVSYSASDNVGISSCSFASGSNVALGAGANTIVVSCRDDAGNLGSDSVVVKRDASPPTISITSPADGSGTTSTTAQLSYTASDDVGNPTCTPASGTSLALGTGANTLTVSCTDSVGRTASTSVIVHRGTPPVVAISAPADGTNTQDGTVNIAYTVNGSTTIPGGTSCKVNEAASFGGAVNNVALAVGANPITVRCTNLFGNGSGAVSVNRGSAPSVAITAPANNTNTTAGSVNVAFKVNGSGSIPAATSCTVDGSTTSSATTNSVSLVLGAKSIDVTCVNAFGSGSAAVTVTRGVAPVVAILAPVNNTLTSSESVNTVFSVGGSASIPAGTTCHVNDSVTSSAAENTVALVTGPNTITATCSSAFGTDSDSVSVVRGNGPTVAITAPSAGLSTTATKVNLAFTVDGDASIPDGTTCRINGAQTTSATANSVTLSLGTNTLAVACSNALGEDTQSVVVARGVPPSVVVIAPASGAKTVAPSINVAYTVDGSATLPNDTSCSVAGVASTSAAVNSAALLLGANTLTVACTNPFGAGAATVVVDRGTLPTVEVTAPQDGASTSHATTNVSFTVDGSQSIPAGTTCAVNGAPLQATSGIAIELALGANSIEVACTNAFGDGSGSASLTRVPPPLVLIVSPSAGAVSESPSTLISFVVGGSSSIPAGTQCDVGGRPVEATSGIEVDLLPGANAIEVSCVDEYGSVGSATLAVIYAEPAPIGDGVPAPPAKTDSPAPAITGVTPSRLRSLSSGAPFSTHKRRSAAKFQVMLARPDAVRMSIERLAPRHSSRRASQWQRIKLPAGRSTVYISGRARGRALTPGRYRVRMRIGGAKSALVGRSFRIAR